MDKKNLPLDILIAAGVGLLGSFFPVVSVSTTMGMGGGSANFWNSGGLWGVIPNVLPILAIAAIGVFAFLKAENKWTAPKGLTLGLSIYALAHVALLFLSALMNTGDQGTGGLVKVSLGLGVIIVLAAAGFLFFCVVVKKRL